MIGAEFETVLAGARRGDEDAFARLWRDLNPALLRYLALGGDAAEDVAAETWVTVVRGLHAFRGDESAWRAWVFTTARRRAVDLARKRTREQTLLRRDPSWLDHTAPDGAEVVLGAVTTEEAIALVRRLPPLQAEVVLLRVVAGLSVPEVAETLGRSTGAVRVAAHRGLKALAKLADDRAAQAVTLDDPQTLRRLT